VARFTQEARAAAGLSHPNIVAVFDSGSEAGMHHLVIEHVEARSASTTAATGPTSRCR
jgi:eukaryotic-like serine/threonine-protein kinase